MHRPITVVAALLAWLAATAPRARAAPADAWRAVPTQVSAEGVPAALGTIEMHGAPGVKPGDAAFALGQFHYARGEYRAAADAFLRAVPPLLGAWKLAARYQAGLSLLALGSPSQARGALEEVARAGGAQGALARLAIAHAWEAEHRPEQALEVLRRLLAEQPGEAGPAALERYAALSEQAHREADARDARRRLLHEYPASIEAARAPAPQRPARERGKPRRAKSAMPGTVES